MKRSLVQRELFWGAESSNSSANNNLAVLLIDMQEDFLKNFKTEFRAKMISAQAKALKLCIENNLSLVLIKFCDFGEIDSALLKEIEHYKNQFLVLKYHDNAFYETDLESILRRLRVKTLFVMGINTSYCVYSTVVAGKGKGYKIITSEELVGDPFVVGVGCLEAVCECLSEEEWPFILKGTKDLGQAVNF